MSVSAGGGGGMRSASFCGQAGSPPQWGAHRTPRLWATPWAHARADLGGFCAGLVGETVRTWASNPCRCDLS